MKYLLSLLVMGLAVQASADGLAKSHAKVIVLTNRADMTLYTFSKDKLNESVCFGPCATAWPPLAADADAVSDGTTVIIERADGIRQISYKGKPLYFYAPDKEAGDIKGDLVGGVWYVARP